MNPAHTQDQFPDYLDVILESSFDMLFVCKKCDDTVLKLNSVAATFFEIEGLPAPNLSLAALGISYIEIETDIVVKIQHGHILFSVEARKTSINEDLFILCIKNCELSGKESEQFSKAASINSLMDAYSDKKIGEDYFQAIVNALCKGIEADFAFIAEVSKKNRSSNALYMSQGGVSGETMTYDLAHTPCNDVACGEVCAYERNIQQLFPKDLLLVEMGIESYFGMPISIRDINTEGAWILVILFQRTVSDKEFYIYVMTLVANRIKVEKERALLLNALLASNELLEVSQEIAKVGSWEYDLVNDYHIWSKEHCHIFEIDEKSSSKDIFDAFRKLLHPKDLENVDKALKEGIENAESFDFTYRIRFANGRMKYIRSFAKTLYDKGGNPYKIVGTIQDITKQKLAEIELDNTRAMLQETAELAKVGGWEVHWDTKKIYWSKITREIHDLPGIGEFSNEMTRGFVQDEAIALQCNLAMRKAAQTGEPFAIDMPIVTKKGQTKWIRSIGKSEIRDGRCVRVYGTIQDITEQKRLEEALAKANEEEFAQLYHQQLLFIEQLDAKNREINRFFELSFDMICILDVNGMAQRLNPAFSKVLGYPEALLLSEPIYDFMFPDKIVFMQSLCDAIINDSNITQFTNRYLTNEGHYKWLAWHVVFDIESKLFYAIARDITDEKKAVKEIEDLKYTLDQTNIVAVLDNEYKILSVNDKFCETSGFLREEIIGQKYYHFFEDNLNRDYWHRLSSTIEQKKIWQGELISITKEGGFYWADTSVVPFYDINDLPFQYIIIQSDITGRKQLEIELRNSREEALNHAQIKENFLANMSHEIRTPMNAISGFSQLLLQTALNESQQEYVQAISSSSENLLVIINDILDFSKITSGKFEIEYRQYNFRKSIQDVINTLKPLISQKKLLFEVQIDEQVPEYIRACPSRINQVLINLIGNALKFTKEGTVLVEVNVKDAKFLLFKVKDTGIGIAEEKIESIFESFTQAEKYITRMYGGTGLGLSISKKLVELMGGNIAVQSKIGEGSVFYFNIPFETVAAQASIKNEINKAENTNKRMKILIVEDNRINQKLVITILNGMNCVCDLAEDGQKAVAMASESHYDLIFMDIQMPIMDGMEATRLIRERDKEIPIVAMTAHSLEHEKQLCFNLGMNDYLTKPFRREDLLKIVSKYALGG